MLFLKNKIYSAVDYRIAAIKNVFGGYVDSKPFCRLDSEFCCVSLSVENGTG